MKTSSPSTTATGRGARTARVAFVGAGPGDPTLLTLRAVELLGQADVVVIDQLARHDLIARYARPDVQVVDAGHGEHGQVLTHASRAKLVVAAATSTTEPDGLVVRLMDGDPATFHGLAEEALACQRAGIPIDIVPGVSAVSAVPAYAGVPLTMASTRAVHVLPADDSEVDLSGSVDPRTTVVFLGPPEALHRRLAQLRAAGRAGDCLVAVTQRGTTTAQTTLTMTLAEAASTRGPMRSVSVPALAVVGATVAHRDTLSWFETRPLFGWDVLIPRTKEQAGSTERRLEAYGAHGTVVPTIAVEPPRTPQAMERAIKGLVTGRYEWIGFTSVNAVRAVREKVEAFGLDARVLSGLKVAAVGGATADALRDWGITADLVPSGESSAAGLLAEWPAFDPEVDPIDRVLLPRADIATETLVAGLQGAGWEVDDVTAYRTVRAAPPAPEVREAIKSGAFDAVVFTSSSTVRNLIGIAGKPPATTVVACIGPQTARTAEEYGLTVHVLAPTATVESLVDALADHGHARARAAAEAGEAVTRPSQRRTGGRRRASR